MYSHTNQQNLSRGTKVAVVILNWNGKTYLEMFLPGVVAHCPEFAAIYVADNGSTDGSVAFLEENYPQVNLIKFGSNNGYTGGYNKSLSQINSEYYILLNSDIKVDSNWIEPVIELMDMDKNIAACQPKIRSYNQPEYFEYAGAAGGFIDIFGYPFCRGRIFEAIEIDHRQYDDNIEIFWATGACLFLRAKDFWEAGAFDDDFFAHMEEIDLCWRLKKLGKKVMYCGSSTVYHVGGGALPRGNPRKTYLNFRNSLLTLAKNADRKMFCRTMLVRLIFDVASALRFLFLGYSRDAFAVLKAWYNSFHCIAKRRKFAHSLSMHQVSGIYGKSIVLKYFVCRKHTFSSLLGRKP